RIAAIVRDPRLPGHLHRAPLRPHGRRAHRAAVGTARPTRALAVRPSAWVALVAVVLALAPLMLPHFFLQLLTEIAIVGLFATAVNLLMGFGGMVSFGHEAYFALGAYTAALLVKKASVPMLLALPVAPIVAAAGALFFGFFIVRLTHTYFAMLSGLFSGVAGALFAFYNGSVFPDFAYFTKSFEPLVVALLGGVHSFFGPLVGALGFKILEWLISRQWPIYWPLFLGGIVVLVIVVLPQGFVGLL